MVVSYPPSADLVGREHRSQDSNRERTPRYRSRCDLQFERADSSGSVGLHDARWIVFDPVTRKSYRIGWVERWMLIELREALSLAELLRRFQDAHSDSQLGESRLSALLARFVACELIVTAESQMRPAHDGDASLRSGGWNAAVSGMVSWRIRGVDPDNAIRRLVGWTKLVYSGRAVRFWLVIATFTMLALTFDFQRLTDQARVVDWLARPATGGMLFVVFLLTRALHELGHAIVCRSFGVRCPDIGVFLILGAPCVYCDVSESWKLPDRSKRAAIAAAGMYTEIVVATLAAWIWLLTIDGTTNTLALQTMFVCSISTVLINANPLMRFDGYYILADWLDQSNLRQKADMIAWHAVRRMVTGVSTRTGEESRQSIGSRGFVLFSIAGWIYRAGLSITIATVLVMMYSAWNMVWVGRVLAIAVLVTWWGVPVLKLVASLVRESQKIGARFRLLTGIVLLALAIGYFPIPSRRFSTGWLQPTTMQGVYANVTARLVDHQVSDGERVEIGQPLFQLESDAIDVRRLQRLGELEKAKARRDTYRTLREMRGEDVDLDRFESDVMTAKALLANAELEKERLRLRARMSGLFCAANASTDRIESAASDGNQDGSSMWSNWCGLAQIGRTVPQGALLGAICSDEAIAILPLSEKQLADVASGSEVRLRFSELPGKVAVASVEDVVRFHEVSRLWERLEPGAQGPEHAEPTSEAASFAAIVKVPAGYPARVGTSVDAVFVGPAQTLASTGLAWLQANLRLLAE